jgi:hypothetical protein
MLVIREEYYAFHLGQASAKSRGFNAKFQDDGNQVRHAAGALCASVFSHAAYLYMQFRELNDALRSTDQDVREAALADIALNYHIAELANAIEAGVVSGVRLGSELVRRLS